METTLSLEFLFEVRQHLKDLEHQLRHISGVHVDLVVPRDSSAPVLVSMSINEHRGQAPQQVAQTLYSFLHEDQSMQGQKQIFLVTKEGDRVDIENLSVEEINNIIVTAQEGM
jgi:hypothetical protein